MISLLENGYITKMGNVSNFSYILHDNSVFLSTEYKVLQSQSNSCFVKCMKMLYNGKVQIYYLTNSLKPFSSMIGTLEPESFLTIVANLLEDVIDVKKNGFLSCQNIDISFEHIFVDPATYKVSLVYLPLSKKVYDDTAAFENELRTGLIKLISSIGSLSSPKTIQFSVDLSNGTLSMEDLHARIKGAKSIISRPEATIHASVQGTFKLRISAMNAPEQVELIVDKNEYIIGKNVASVDGVVGFNKMISRVHCKVINQGGQYAIMDLQSANGTYVNRVRLQPNQPYPIKNGDVIRLANSDFQVSIM